MNNKSSKSCVAMLNCTLSDTKKEKRLHKNASLSVGATGFEPATTWSQTRRATGLRYTPLVLLMFKFLS